MTVVLERCFCYRGEQPFLWYVSFSTFCSLKSSVCWLPQEILTVISSHGKFHTKIVQGSTRILSEILSAYCKTKSVVKQKSAGEEELVWWKQQKKAAKLSFPLWNLELLLQISVRANNRTSCTKTAHFFWRKFYFHSWENADVLSFHITENLTTGTVLQAVCEVIKMSFLEKNEPLVKSAPPIPIAASCSVTAEQILMYNKILLKNKQCRQKEHFFISSF